MKTLLGLIGSPRNMGNSELLVKEIYRQLPNGWELHLLSFSDFDIQHCRGCYQCLMGKMTCVLKDDFGIALDALVRSDAYVLATPTYVLGANASVKRFLDRALTFYRYIDELWEKPAVGIVVAGFPGLDGYAKLQVDTFMDFSFADNRGSEVVFAALPGEALIHQKGKDAAKRLADALVAEKSHARKLPATPSCTQCGGDTFRFLDAGSLKCMRCSSEGSYSWAEGRLQTEIPRPQHPLFQSYEDAKNHLAWLRGMKDEFRARRRQLKSLVAGYSAAGTWIRRRTSDE